jgi:hypothetical protein
MLLSFRNELNKEHLELDAIGRVSKIYVASDTAITGDPCLVKEFIYYGITTTVKGRQEGYGKWNSSFDGNQVLLTDDLSNLLTDNLGNQLVEI